MSATDNQSETPDAASPEVAGAAVQQPPVVERAPAAPGSSAKFHTTGSVVALIVGAVLVVWLAFSAGWIAHGLALRLQQHAFAGGYARQFDGPGSCGHMRGRAGAGGRYGEYGRGREGGFGRGDGYGRGGGKCGRSGSFGQGGSFGQDQVPGPHGDLRLMPYGYDRWAPAPGDQGTPPY